MDERDHRSPCRTTPTLDVTPILTLPGWLVTNRVKPSGNELRVLNHKSKRSGDAAVSFPTQFHQIRAAIVDGREPVIDEKRLSRAARSGETQVRRLSDSHRPSRADASECNQIGYQLELKCRDVEF
jgi:hypothetical protein